VQIKLASHEAADTICNLYTFDYFLYASVKSRPNNLGRFSSCKTWGGQSLQVSWKKPNKVSKMLSVIKGQFGLHGSVFTDAVLWAAKFRDSVSRTTNRKWHTGYGLSNRPSHLTDDVTWPRRCCEALRSAILATAWLLVINSHKVYLGTLIFWSY